MRKKFGKSKISVSFKEVFKVIKVFEEEMPELLKVSIAMTYLKCKRVEDFKAWLDYVKQSDKSSGAKRTISLVHDFPRIRNSVSMLWGIDLDKDDVEWSKALSLIGDSVLMSTPISEIVKIRTMDTHSIKDPELKAKVIRAKQQVALPPMRSSKETGDTGDLFKVLMNRAMKNN